MILQGKRRVLTSNWESFDLPFTREVRIGEHERILDAAIMQPTAAKRLVQMQIHATTAPVMQNEVPGSIARPWIDPVHSLLGEGDEQAFGIGSLNPQIQIRVFPCLFADQCIDGPTPPMHTPTSCARGAETRVCTVAGGITDSVTRSESHAGTTAIPLCRPGHPTVSDNAGAKLHREPNK